MLLFTLKTQEPYSSHMELIEKIIDRIGCGSGLSDDQLEDFRGTVYLKLMKDDSAVLRKFKGGSSLKTYLYSVIHNQFRDFRDKLWGYWQPSVKARELGSLAVELESLVSRDGYLFHEAVQIIRGNQRVPIDERELEEIYASLPIRVARQILDAGFLDQAVDPRGRPDEKLLLEEWAYGRDRIRSMLQGVIQYLSVEDRFIVRMHFWENATVARMAKTLGYNQKWLYRHIHKILKKLGKTLLENGIVKEEVIKHLNPPVG